MFRSLTLFLLFAAPAVAQDAPLTPDRPGFTASGVVVALGDIQVESGATVQFTDGAEAISGPKLLVRWTPLERVELRLGAPDYRDGNALQASGFTDPSLGIKTQFGPVNDWDFAVIAAVSIPVGADAFSTGSVDPRLILAAGRSLSQRVSLGGQVQTARSGSTNRWTVGGTVALGCSLTDRLGTFVEIASFAPENTGSETYLQHGYTLLVHRALQFDVHGALGLTDSAPDYLLGAGLSVRP